MKPTGPRRHESLPDLTTETRKNTARESFNALAPGFSPVEGSRAHSIAKTSGAPTQIHHLKAAGRDNWPKMAGYFADVVVFDPKTIQDHTTYENPHQLATGVADVIINGGLALDNGVATGAHTGKIVRGQGWTGWKDGGCRASAKACMWPH